VAFFRIGEKRGRKPNSQVGPDGAKLETGTPRRQKKNQTDSDSDDNFEVLPFKRRQVKLFNGTDEGFKDEIFRESP
jgi:hypothetical protein